jgi:hypothetical protein
MLVRTPAELPVHTCQYTFHARDERGFTPRSSLDRYIRGRDFFIKNDPSPHCFATRAPFGLGRFHEKTF